MSKLVPQKKQKTVTELHTQLANLEKQLVDLKKTSKEPITIQLGKTQAHFHTLRNKKGFEGQGMGRYLLFVQMTATTNTVYIPLSIASGRKSTGFIYQVEGTTKGTGTATISCTGDGVVTVTAGTISFVKIPPGKTGVFKILTEVLGAEGKSYKVVVSRINYKLNPNDLRYRRFLTEISTEMIKFT